MLGDVHHERGLAHRRTGGDDEHFPRLEALAHAVEVGVTGGRALDFDVAGKQGLEVADDFADRLLDVEAAGGLVALADAEHAGFHAVEQREGFLRVLEGFGDGFGAGPDHAAEDVFVLHQREVVVEVRGVRRVSENVGNRRRATDAVEVAAVVEELDQRDEFDVGALRVEIAQGFEKEAVTG